MIVLHVSPQGDDTWSGRLPMPVADGRDNIVRNNVFVDSAVRQIVLSKAEPHRSFSFTGNVVAWRTGPAIAGAWEKGITETRDNCWWREDGRPVDFLGRSLADWQDLGHERGSVVANPKFVDASRHDYRLAADSPSPEFSRLNWTGLSSHGPDGTVVHFDDYRIERVEDSPEIR